MTNGAILFALFTLVVAAGNRALRQLLKLAARLKAGDVAGRNADPAKARKIGMAIFARRPLTWLASARISFGPIPGIDPIKL